MKSTAQNIDEGLFLSFFNVNVDILIIDAEACLETAQSSELSSDVINLLILTLLCGGLLVNGHEPIYTFHNNFAISLFKFPWNISKIPK